jgi:hypothetical protein
MAAAAGDMADDPRLGIVQRFELEQRPAAPGLIGCIGVMQHQALATGSHDLVETPLQRLRRGQQFLLHGLQLRPAGVLHQPFDALRA